MGCKVKTTRTGCLAFRLFWNKISSWEGTALADTVENRTIMEGQAAQIAKEMKRGAFDYLKWFPEGNKAVLFRPKKEICSVRDYYETWIKQMVPPFVRKSAERDYRQHFNRYILPRYGNVELGAVTPRSLLEFRTYLTQDLGLALKTSKNIMDGSFRAMMRDARTVDGLIRDDPFESLQWPRREETVPDPFTGAERDKILQWFRTNQPYYYPFIYTLFWTGMRPSEVVALRIGDIDLKRGTATITRSRHIGDENAPKTKGSRRTVFLLPTVVERLRNIKQLRVTEDDYVFTNKEGGPIDPDQWRKDYWYHALRSLGIRERKFYATRHTYISFALSAGENIKWIAEQCGTSILMIQEHYGKFIGDDGGSFLRALAEKSEMLSETDSTLDDQPIDFIEKAMASPTGFEPVSPA